MKADNRGMSSAAAEVLRDKIELSLEGRQVFYIFFAGAVLAAVVFVLGVSVGRRVEANASVPAFDSASDPLAALDRLNVAVGVGVGSETDETDGVADDSVDDLVFADALRGDGDDLAALDKKLSEGLRRGAKRNAVAVRGNSGQQKVVAKRERIAQAKKGDPEHGDVGEVLEQAERKREAQQASAATAKPGDASSRTKFTLQLSSFQNRGEAKLFHKKLSNAGYQPYIVKADVSGRGTWFRVRLGQYRQYEDALSAKAKFEKAQKMIAYVTRVEGDDKTKR